MNTPAIISPANLLQANTPAPGKPDLGASSDGPSFNQVLTREMGEQTQAAAPPPPAPTASQDASKTVQQDADSKSEPAKSDSSADGKDNANANADASNKVDDSNKVASGKDAKKDDKDSDRHDPTDQAGIAAFVAALTSAKAAPADNATQPAAAVAVDGKSEIQAKNERIDIASRIVNPDVKADGKQEAVGKKSDFVAALDKAKADTGSATKDASAMETGTLALAAKAPDAANIAGTLPQGFAAAMAATAVQPNGEVQGPASNTLLPTVGSAGWDDALGQKVVWMAKGMEQTATLTLNPPDLGPMQVTVNVANNQATASFVAHQPEVRHALEASMPRLREMLNEAGIQLGQSSVHAGMPNQGSFEEARQGGGRRVRSDAAVDTAVHVSHVPTPRSGSGMVDTFA